MRERILIIDDDPKICSLVSDILTENKFKTVIAQTTEEAWDQVVLANPDLILLDVEVPLKGGLEFCRELKAKESYQHIPVIFLTVRSQEIDKVSALSIGGDDFITKPFNQRELVARIRVALRRSSLIRADGYSIKSGSLLVDFDKRIAEISRQDVHLTPKEFELLKLLYTRRHHVLSEGEIFDKVWGAHCNSLRATVYTHVNRLRRKLKEHGIKIKTIPGTGFRFDERKNR